MTKDKKPYTHKAIIKLEIETTHPKAIDAFALYQRALGYHEYYVDGKLEAVHIKKSTVERKTKL